MKILVLGHTGLIGSNLMESLKGTDHEVVGASRSTGYDLNDLAQTQELFDEVKPELVYMLAADAAEARGQIAPRHMTQNNIGILVNVLIAMVNSGVKKIIYTSSSAVYGGAPTPHVEWGNVVPKDVYAVNKLMGEKVLKVMAEAHDFNYTIVRPHNVYGPHQRMNDPYRNVVALFMRKLIEGEGYYLFGAGMMKRSFTYAPDLADALVRLSDERYDGMTANVGAKKASTIRELSDLIQEVSGLSADVELKPARPQEMHDSILGHRLQDTVLEYANTPLREGLEKTWEWVKDQKLGELIVKEDEIRS